MTRFWGNHQGTRQWRGRRRVKPATREENLESMYRELRRREASFPIDHPYVQAQREAIAREELHA
jgi:hypothetical protein